MSGSVWSMFAGSLLGKNHTLNFDGSHNNQANKAGAGCIIRDSQGELVIAASYSLTENYPTYCDVAVAEAVALRNGLSLAKENNLNINIIKGDSKEVIDHVLGCSRRPARPVLSQIIQEITRMIDLSSQKIVVVDREANRVADKLAFWGSSRLQGGRMVYNNYADLPPQVGELIRREMSMSGSSGTELEYGEGSSKLGMAGVAVTGAAMLAWGVSKFMFGESSSDDQQPPTKEISEFDGKNKTFF